MTMKDAEKRAWQLQRRLAIGFVLAIGILSLLPSDIAKTLGVLAALILGFTLLTSLGNFLRPLHTSWQTIVEALEGAGILHTPEPDKDGHETDYHPSLLFGAVRKPIKDWSGAANFVTPFVPSPVTAAYHISIYISHEDLLREREFSKGEAEIIRGNTFPISMEISWQRWSSGYERLVVTAKNNKGVLLDYKERNVYQRFARYDGPVFSVGFGEPSSGRFEVLVKRHEISMYLIGGRFGIKPVRWEDRYLEHETAPKPEWVLFQVPLDENALQPFQTGKASFDHTHGLPARFYSLPRDLEPGSLAGINCSLHLYQELRPLVLGEVQFYQPPSSRQSYAGVLVSFDFAQWSPRYGRERKSWLVFRLEEGMNLQKGDLVYMVFDEAGQVEKYWKRDQLDREMHSDDADDEDRVGSTV